MLTRLFVMLAVFVTSVLTFSAPASALEYLFTRDYYEREARPAVKGVAVYKRGRVGRRHMIKTQRAKYRWVTRRVVVRPPYTTYRRTLRGKRVAVHHGAVRRTIRQRVLVRPVRYRAHVKRGRHGWVKHRAIVHGRAAFTKNH